MSCRPVILWAEDDDNDALLLERAFQKAGVSGSFIRVTDGAQVRAYLTGQGRYADRREFPVPQLLLLDIKMPRMSGLDVLKWKQSVPELRSVAVVVLSSSDEATDLEQAFSLGAKLYLVKPAKLDEWIGQAKRIEAECLTDR